jgi:adenylosuccinate synthase
MATSRNICVVGAQWGDEGKGKIVDLLAGGVDIVARYQGGANAGHTVKVGGREFVLHLVPSGIVHPKVQCLIGNGVVVDPKSLLEELSLLRKQGISVAGRLHISANTHLTLPYHVAMDKAREARRGGAIGTTHRGIGPTYADKAARVGITVGDLVRFHSFQEKLRRNFEEKNFILQNYYHQKSIVFSEILSAYRKYSRALKPLVCDGAAWLNRMMAAGKTVLFEGAQGTFLDMDFGTYPYVTSSSTIAGGACTGLGVGPGLIGKVILVAKAYTTRVGHGPFPTEFDPEMAEAVRAKAGDEFGRTTGRPRRCGWFDAAMVRRAVQLNGAAGLALTKLDVLDGLKELKIGTGYRAPGLKPGGFPWSAGEMAECRPVYRTLPGWQERTGGIRRYRDLPANARKYIEAIEKLAGVKVEMISVGADREATIVR